MSEYDKKSKQINVFEINTKIPFSQSVSLIVTWIDERIKLTGLLYDTQTSSFSETAAEGIQRTHWCPRRAEGVGGGGAIVLVQRQTDQSTTCSAKAAGLAAAFLTKGEPQSRVGAEQ